MHRAGNPMDLEDFSLDDCLLVDTFGVWETRGEEGERKLRIIINFKANSVNDYAWMPEKVFFLLSRVICMLYYYVLFFLK